jgi:hypothetical protein
MHKSPFYKVNESMTKTHSNPATYSETDRYLQDSRNFTFKKAMNTKPPLLEKVNSGINLTADDPISLLQYGKKIRQEDKLVKKNTEILEGNGPASLHSTLKGEDRLKTMDQKFVKFSEPMRSRSPPLTSKNEDYFNKGILKTYDGSVSPKLEKQISADRTRGNISSLLDWLTTLGFAQIFQQISLDADVIEEFKDGIILCRIIERLEMKEILGLIVKPKTNASKLVNIRKALQVLAKRPGVNPHSLYIDDKILSGDGAAIRDLLFNVRDAYRFMNKCLSRSNMQNSSRGGSVMSSYDGRGKKNNESMRLYNPPENYILSNEERHKIIAPPKYAHN